VQNAVSGGHSEVLWLLANRGADVNLERNNHHWAGKLWHILRY
jgi:hypothetical protein